jgi:hypothetical protein
MRWATTALLVTLCAFGCTGSARVSRSDLQGAPVTLAQVPTSFELGTSLRPDGDVTRVCVYADAAYALTDHLTWRTSAGQEARLAGDVELADTTSVTLSDPSSDGSSLCLRVTPASEGERASTRRIRLRTSSPVDVVRVVWESELR